MNQKEIASVLKISRATVSLALNNSKLVKKETRERIQKLAEAAGYHPNLNARSLVTGKTFTVGIILPNVIYSFYGDLIEEMQEMLRARNYTGVFFSAAGKKEIIKALEMLKSRQVDGVISTQFDSEIYSKITELELPFVSLVKSDELPVNYVAYDRHAAGEAVTRHLIALGHKKIAFLGTSSDARFEGYRNCLNKHGLVPDKNLVIIKKESTGKKFPRAIAYTGMQRLLESKKNFSAVVFQSDVLATGAFRAIHEAGLSIPGDLAVVSMDNVDDAEYTIPPLTSMDFSRKKLAGEAVSLLMDAINYKGKNFHRTVLLDPKLIIRQSCGSKKGR